MIPAAFDYHRPASLSEALALLEEHGDEAKLLAGGHSLLPAMKFRFSTPAHVIDLGGLSALRYIREEGDQLAIGACTTHEDLEKSELIGNHAGALAQAAASIGDPQVRVLGTIGGSLAHADPAADYPAPVLALGAQFVIQGPSGSRTEPAAEFFKDLFLTSLESSELVTEIRIPKPNPGSTSAYLKFPQPASRFAVVGCAALITRAGDKATHVALAFTGVSGTPFRDNAVEAALNGKSLTNQTITEASAIAASNVEINADSFAGEDYRRHLARVYAKRALLQASGS